MKALVHLESGKKAIIVPGGRIANVGVHGHAVPLHLETHWSQNITLTTILHSVTRGRSRPSG